MHASRHVIKSARLSSSFLVSLITAYPAHSHNHPSLSSFLSPLSSLLTQPRPTR